MKKKEMAALVKKSHLKTSCVLHALREFREDMIATCPSGKGPSGKDQDFSSLRDNALLRTRWKSMQIPLWKQLVDVVKKSLSTTAIGKIEAEFGDKDVKTSIQQYEFHAHDIKIVEVDTPVLLMSTPNAEQEYRIATSENSLRIAEVLARYRIDSLKYSCWMTSKPHSWSKLRYVVQLLYRWNTKHKKTLASLQHVLHKWTSEYVVTTVNVVTKVVKGSRKKNERFGADSSSSSGMYLAFGFVDTYTHQK